MQRQRSIPTFEDQIAADKARLKAQIALLRDGPRRAELIEKIRELENINEWISSPGLPHRYFDVIGGQSGKRYRIRYGTSMNIFEIDSRGRT
jgi:hypothetical protein